MSDTPVTATTHRQRIANALPTVACLSLPDDLHDDADRLAVADWVLERVKAAGLTTRKRAT